LSHITEEAASEEEVYFAIKSVEYAWEYENSVDAWLCWK